MGDDLVPKEQLPDVSAFPGEDISTEEVGNRGSVVSAVVGALPSLIATGTAVTSDVVEVVGPRFLRAGIADESLRYIKASEGSHLGTVVDSKSGQIVGQVRLSDSPLPAAAAVAGAFQVASFVTGQYYLNAIDQRLAAIEASLDRVTGRLEYRAAAELEAAHQTVDELRRLFTTTGEFADRDWDRLAEAETNARTVYFEELGIAAELAERIGRAGALVREALRRSGTSKPARGGRSLKSELASLGKETVRSREGLNRLLRAAHLVAEIGLLRAAAESQRHHERGEMLQREAGEILRSLSVGLGNLVGMNALSGISESDLSRLFAFDGKPTKSLIAFERDLKPVTTAVLQVAQSLRQLEFEDVGVLRLEV
ncbi:MAG: hypothetical protein WD598_00915 [Acidimicrobiia bacterium]